MTIFNDPPWQKRLPGLGPRPLVPAQPKGLPPPQAKVAQSLLEATVYGNPNAIAAQSLLEAAVTGTPTANVAQVLLEAVVYYNRGTGNIPTPLPLSYAFIDEWRPPLRLAPSVPQSSVSVSPRPRTSWELWYSDEWRPSLRLAPSVPQGSVPVPPRPRTSWELWYSDEWQPAARVGPAYPQAAPIPLPVRSNSAIILEDYEWRPAARVFAPPAVVATATRRPTLFVVT